MPTPLLITTPSGLFCPAADAWIDPWRPVPRALITHAHSDHARVGSDAYLCAADGVGVLRERMGFDARISGLAYGATTTLNDVTVSFHPAGHLLGSAQIRLERGGEVWVVSGDYGTTPNPTCAAFTPVRAHTFVTESTFGLPIYRWRAPDAIFAELNAWWRANADAGRASVVFAYALGKAQRVLAGIDPSIGPVVVHGAVARLSAQYQAMGVALPVTTTIEDLDATTRKRALIVAPPSTADSPWLRRFGEPSTAFASGWMAVRGQRRRRNVDLGLTLSDHADWPGLLASIAATGAERVLVTHGQVPTLVRWLREHGRDAAPLLTEYGGDEDAEPVAVATSSVAEPQAAD